MMIERKLYDRDYSANYKTEITNIIQGYKYGFL